MAQRSVPGATAAIAFIFDNSLLLIAGALAGLLWANINPQTYTTFTGSLRFVINDLAMVFFFGLAMEEVVEAMLPGGPLSSPREGALPLLAAIGGMAAPAAVFLLCVRALHLPDVHAGWAISCATDIAFSFLAARLVFPRASPAMPFLLLLAIADDALGLIVLAVFYPSGSLSLVMLAALLIPAMALAWTMRRFGVENFWLYVFGPGLLSWLGLFYGGLHPVLALVPIVPLMPHHRSDLRVFGRTSRVRLMTLTRFAEWWKVPIQFVLLAFGLANAGVPFAAVGPVTWIVLVSLVSGKPIGIVGTSLLAELFGLRRAPGLDVRALVTLGIAAGTGFTVALFFATAAFPPGPVLDQAKMGALLSLGAAFVTVGVGRMLGIKPA
jgi:NhaA family Na+:H+ antiporter